MKVGAYGGIAFKVSEKEMLSFCDSTLEESSGYEQHDRIRKRPRLEYTGEELKTFSTTVYADARYGYKPRKVQKRFRKARQAHKPHNFLLNGKRVGDCKFVIQSVKANYVAYAMNGEPEVMKFDITFLECPTKSKKRSASKNNSKKTGGKTTKSGKARQKTSVNRKSYKIVPVNKGDSYWSLAVRYYKNGTKYKKIMAANPGHKKLLIGDRIKIPA